MEESYDGAVDILRRLEIRRKAIRIVKRFIEKHGQTHGIPDLTVSPDYWKILVDRIETQMFLFSPNLRNAITGDIDYFYPYSEE